ncbi:MAG: YafY family transcriptional regulator [Bacteroidales bacterium]|nr:YafY family transcriptional regulator [Bacteroidales bacterium]
MNRIDRLTAMLILLQTKRFISSVEIAQRFGISQRTVYRDIRALEEAGVPIGAETGKGYFIVDGYNLPPVMFTKEEAGSLIIAGKLVDKLTDASVRNNHNLAVDKIKAILHEHDQDYINSLTDQIAVFFSRPQQNENTNDDYITRIQQSLATRKCLKIDYHANYSLKKTYGRIIDPLGLVFYGNTWHLIGYCKLRNDMRDFRVDRILNLELTEKCATDRKPDELKNYFRNWWDETELLEVNILFDHAVTKDISGSKYYFGFLSEKFTELGMEMKFAVEDYQYIAHWLMSFGNKMKIISPKELSEIIKSKVKALAEIFL